MSEQSIQFDLKGLYARKSKLAEHLETIKIMETGIKTEFWKRVKSLTKEKIDFIDGKLDKFQGLTQDERTIYLQMKLDMKYFWTMAEDIVKSKDKIEVLVSQNNDKISILEEKNGKRKRQ